MGKKADARAERQQRAQEAFERAKPGLVARFAAVVEAPRVAQLPDAERMVPRVGVPLADLVIPEQPRIASDGSRHSAVMTWCVRKGDLLGSWSWAEPRAWTADEWTTYIAPKFNEFERLTWGELQKQASGEGHLMHHEQDVGTLIDEAQDRWLQLDLEEFDTAFRFRLSNTQRFWGFIVQGHFFGVWWDRYHSIYPTAKG